MRSPFRKNRSPSEVLFHDFPARAWPGRPSFGPSRSAASPDSGAIMSGVGVLLGLTGGPSM